jgi:hypothetical protein
VCLELQKCSWALGGGMGGGGVSAWRSQARPTTAVDVPVAAVWAPGGWADLKDLVNKLGLVGALCLHYLVAVGILSCQAGMEVVEPIPLVMLCSEFSTTGDDARLARGESKKSRAQASDCRPHMRVSPGLPQTRFPASSGWASVVGDGHGGGFFTAQVKQHVKVWQLHQVVRVCSQGLFITSSVTEDAV